MHTEAYYNTIALSSLFLDFFSEYNSPMPERDLLTRKETMEYLRISRGMLDRIMKRRDLPFIKLGKKVLFRKSDIDRFLESKLVK